MLILLKVAKDNQEFSIRDIIEQIANRFNLSDEERNVTLPNGQQTRIRYRIKSIIFSGKKFSNIRSCNYSALS